MLCDDPELLDDFIDHGCIYIDLAVDQLEDAGLLKRTWLASKLVNDELDYRIELTEYCQAFLDSGVHFTYYPAE